MHFDFTTPKSLQFTPNHEKIVIIIIERGEQEKEDKRVEGKKTDIPFQFYIDSGEKRTLEVFFNTVFINPDIYILLLLGAGPKCSHTF